MSQRKVCKWVERFKSEMANLACGLSPTAVCVEVKERIRNNQIIDNYKNPSKMSTQTQNKIFYSDGIRKVGTKLIKNRSDYI